MPQQEQADGQGGGGGGLVVKQSKRTGGASPPSAAAAVLAMATTSSSSSGGSTSGSSSGGVATALTVGTINQVTRLGYTTNRGVATVSRYLGRTIIARAAAATITEIGRFTADRTREMLDYATLRFIKAGQKPLPPENGWGDVGRRLGSISAYELQLIDEKIRDIGLIDFADMLGVKDPGELLHMAELRQRASKGDEEAQYALAARFCPPPFRKQDRCKKCQKSFGVTRYRHHCRHCGESFCQEHSTARHAIPKIGYMTPARVCLPCKAQLEEEDLKDRIVWRMVRIEAFLQDRLIPYFEAGDSTHLDKALRAVGDVLTSAAKKAPLRSTTALAAEAMELFGKYGLSGMAGILLRHEFMEAVELLKEVSGVDKAWPVSGNQLRAAMYYLLAKGRGERGADPDAEQAAHRGCPPVSDGLLQDLLNLAPLALHFAYCDSPVEMQLKAQQQGWRLIFIQTQVQPGQPAFALYCHLSEKEVCVVVRGPEQVQDVLPEIHGLPLPFPPASMHDGDRGGGGGEGGWAKLSTEWLASCGIGEAAQWLFSEIYPHIRRLLAEGYSLTLLGHSLGGAVAALLGVLLREEGITEGVKCYSFGSPSCVNGNLAQLCEAFSTVVVLHDDVVPRITPTGVRGLLRDLLQEKETAEQHWQDDVEAIIVKSKGRWAPRWRRISSRVNGTMRKGSSLSFVRSEEGEGEETGGGGGGGSGRAHTHLNGHGNRRQSPSSTSSLTTGGQDNNEGWDSCDDDFVDYWGVGCTREPSSSSGSRRGGGAASNPNSYSIRNEDGSTTTVDLSAMRRRLLESNSLSGGSTTAAQTNTHTHTSIPRPPATTTGGSSHGGALLLPRRGGGIDGEEEERGQGIGGVSSTIQARGFMEDDDEDDYDGDGRSGRRSSCDNSVQEEEDEEEGGRRGGFVQDGEEEDEESEGEREEEDRAASRRRRVHEEEENEEEEDDNMPLFNMFGTGSELLGAADGEQKPAAGDDWEEEEEEGEGEGDEDDDEELLHSSSGESSNNAHAAAGPPSPASPAALETDAVSSPRPSQSPSLLQPRAAAAAAAALVAPKASSPSSSSSSSKGGEEGEEDDVEGGVFVEDVNLPELYPPGRLVHIYSYRGVFKACMPQRDFPDLRRISLQGNLLRDHDPKAYFTALCEVIDVRRAPATPPTWEGFKDTEACACCAVDLTWQCAAASEAQRYRDKHNCRCCGRLVCQGCSSHRMALPSIGLALPARVCDRCFFGGKHSAEASSHG